MPIRWRLTLWYTGILLAVLVVLGSAVYFLLERSLMAEIDRYLEAKATEVVKSTKVVGTLPFFLRQVVLPDVEVFAAPDVYLQVVALKGEIAVRSKNLGNYSLPVDEKAVQEMLKKGTAFQTFSVGEEKFKMILKPLIVEREIVGFLQVARPLKSLTLALGRLKNILVFGGFISVLLALALGWFMSGKALSPIGHLTREAKTIGENRAFHSRVKYVGPRDELGELALTFNKMLENLEEAYRLLEESLQTQKRFVADASHELRTPLTSIQGNVDFLLQLSHESPELQKEVLLDISAETKRLSRLVKDLLTLARADSGLSLNLQEMELKPVLEEVTRQARFLGKNHHFRIEMEEAGDVVLKADVDYFKQLLFIFLDNAFKYTQPGKNVTLIVKRQEDRVELLFADEGPGIPQEDLPHIFDRFYRAGKARSGGGTGLGLAIARWIAVEHGAEISVESTVGQGSIFRISFPIFRKSNTAVGRKV
ncbi:HAMP domain-containing protein [Thermanaerosceptrum fracticalcis]|uniref:histidine kinase n=1 Tax=Thermanaerosceptrum fracticalcis TaxID=1712410 RepID=A0A7G6DYL5_THEFR|nr:HAMP domain-containing sensor histidine kinase [Thermanaerosceptrum fracticalcis]QNB44919.1 HAMP domain-containing protein [Thermanaerosceptrum fracticalcis]